MTVDLTIPFQFSRLPMLPAEDSLLPCLSLLTGMGERDGAPSGAT